MELSEKGVVGRYRKQIPEMFAWKVFTSKINFRNICSTSVCICLPSDFSRSFVNAEFCVHLYALREFECKNLQGFWILLGFLNFLFHYLIIDTCSRENSWKIKICHCQFPKYLGNFRSSVLFYDCLFIFYKRMKDYFPFFLFFFATYGKNHSESYESYFREIHIFYIVMILNPSYNHYSLYFEYNM